MKIEKRALRLLPCLPLKSKFTCSEPDGAEQMSSSSVQSASGVAEPGQWFA